MIALTALDWLGYASTILVIIGFISGLVAWFTGILPAVIRLGNGLAKRKIVIFAKGDHLSSLVSLLTDSKLFRKKNIIDISFDGDLGRAERATLLLVYWDDWQNKIDEIVRKKSDGAALIVYAPGSGSIPRDRYEALNNERNVIVVNLRGRLLNDIVASLITTSYR
jgi:hypothetical protein